MPQRVQRKRVKGLPGMPPGAKYVGRPSRWGNPFWIYKGHTTAGPSWGKAREVWGHISRVQCDAAYVTSSSALGSADAVELFESLMRVRARDEGDRLREWLAPLVGKDLACWCPLDQPCHADVLLRLANPSPSTSTPKEA
jgi:hypothetical protein